MPRIGVMQMSFCSDLNSIWGAVMLPLIMQADLRNWIFKIEEKTFLKGSLGEPIRFYLYLIERQTRIETEELTVHFCERFLH